MDLECPECRRGVPPLITIHQRGVPHSTPGHQVVYDLAYVEACPGCSRGRLVRFSHDCWALPSEEAWDLSSEYPIAAPDLARLRRGIAACPAPRDPCCDCPAHQQLRAEDGRGGTRGGVGVTLTEHGLPRLVTSHW